MDQAREPEDEKSEQRLAEAVKAAGLVEPEDLDWAVGLRRHAASKGRRLRLSQILLKFELLTKEQVESLELGLLFRRWRKVDKFYAKIAVQSDVMPPDSALACLSEQKRLYRSEGRVRRVNAIASEKGLVSKKEDRAIIAAMRKVKPGEIRPADESGPEPAPRLPIDKLLARGIGSSPPAEDEDAPSERPGDLLARAADEDFDLDVPDLADDEPSEPRSPRAARRGEEKEWRERAHRRDVEELSSALDDDPPAPSRNARGGGGGRSKGKPAPSAGSDELLDALRDEPEETSGLL